MTKVVTENNPRWIGRRLDILVEKLDLLATYDAPKAQATFDRILHDVEETLTNTKLRLGPKGMVAKLGPVFEEKS